MQNLKHFFLILKDFEGYYNKTTDPMFFVITLKTDTIDKPHAIHLTKLTAKFRQKAVFQSFLKNHAETPKEYYVESLVK